MMFFSDILVAFRMRIMDMPFQTFPKYVVATNALKKSGRRTAIPNMHTATYVQRTFTKLHTHDAVFYISRANLILSSFEISFSAYVFAAFLFFT